MNTLTAFALYHYQNLPLQQVSYNAFKQPVSIHEQDKERIDFQYNGGLGRAHMYYGSDATDKMARPYYRHYSGDGSMEITEDNPDGKTTFVFYLGGDAYSAPAIWKHEQTSSATTAALYYLHRDYQGSILLITDATGTVQEKRQFDAWGNIVKLTDGSNTALTAFVILDRGYTGHEHLLNVGLINMNGRLYDPILHRFFSPDNFVQDPTNTQNFNRYGYVLNNPLRYTDKNGEYWEEALLGAAIGVITNGIENRINGQNFFHGWVKAAAIGAIGGAVSGGIGDYAAKIPSAYAREAFQMAAHGLLGGLMTAASGGNFWQGFAAGAASSFVTSEVSSVFPGNGFGQVAGVLFTGTVSGGVSEVIAGGNFWDGARDGAISAGLNHAAHLIADPNPKPPDPLLERAAQMLVNGGYQGGPGARPSDSWFLAHSWPSAPWYGNFLGPGPVGNPYFLTGPNGIYLQPIDMLDAAAQRHDYLYDLAQTGGVHGALFEDKVFAADKGLAQAANNIISMASYGLNDSITGKPFTTMEVAWAYRVTFVFSQLGTIKQFGMWLTGK